MGAPTLRASPSADISEEGSREESELEPEFGREDFPVDENEQVSGMYTVGAQLIFCCTIF